MQRFTPFIGILFISFFVISCAGTSETADQDSSDEPEVSKYPSWYPQQEFVSEDDRLLAYATAIDADSVSVLDKAHSWAVEKLKTSVSDKLENIRSEAISELGNGAGLDEAQFLMALRKAKNAVPPLVEKGNTEVQSVEGYESVRGFAEVSVPKEKLVERIGKRLGAYETAWNAMKESKAFDSF